MENEPDEVKDESLQPTKNSHGHGAWILRSHNAHTGMTMEVLCQKRDE